MQVGRVKRKAIAAGNAGGFSLVELLVVTVVLAVLSAVLFPVFIKAKETARISECLSNMRQIGTALHMYLDEYQSRFPAAVPYGSSDYWNSKDRKTLQQLLDPYTQSCITYEVRHGVKVCTSAGVFACPSDTGAIDTSRSDFGIQRNMPVWAATGSSYEYYASLQEDWLHSNVAVPWTALSPLLAQKDDKDRVGAPLNRVPFPTKKAVLGDLCYWHMGDKTPDNRIVFANTLFVDGHAARVPGADHLDSRLQQLERWHVCTELSAEK